VYKSAGGTTLPRGRAPGLPHAQHSLSRPDTVRDVSVQPPDFDFEAILAAAVQRLVRLGKLEAAGALASSSITKFRGNADWSDIEVFIASPGDAFDILTQDDLYTNSVDLNDFGEPYTVWGSSRLATVFTQVLPPRVSCRDVEVKIAAEPVDPNWRDEFKGLLGRGQPPASDTNGAAADAPGERPRRAGRPGWTRELFWGHYRDALGRSAPARTHAAIAAHFEMLDGEIGTDPGYLRRLLNRYGLPPA
jgi:hypothetical protein